MGRQQSFLKFKDKETLVKEVKRYKYRDISDDIARVYQIVRVIKDVKGFDDVPAFNKDEFAIVVGGDRYPQRSKKNLKENLGIENVEEIVYIDNVYYSDMAITKYNGSLGDFLDEHFKALSHDETDELLGVTSI